MILRLTSGKNQLSCPFLTAARYFETNCHSTEDMVILHTLSALTGHFQLTRNPEEPDIINNPPFFPPEWRAKFYPEIYFIDPNPPGPHDYRWLLILMSELVSKKQATIITKKKGDLGQLLQNLFALPRDLFKLIVWNL